jgi:hypothetical protein
MRMTILVVEVVEVVEVVVVVFVQCSPGWVGGW